jgi:DNA helicase HerA-like ATPase
MWFKRQPKPPLPPRITLGTYGNGWAAQPFCFTPAQFRTHRLIRGVTGSGKSEFLKSLCLQQLQAGEHFTLFDPHSDTATGILAYLKDTGFFADERAFSRLWYIKWSRTDFYVPFNILNQPRYSAYELASYIHEAISRAFPTESATPLLSALLLYALVVLIQSRLPIRPSAPEAVPSRKVTAWTYTGKLRMTSS